MLPSLACWRGLPLSASFSYFFFLTFFVDLAVFLTALFAFFTLWDFRFVTGGFSLTIIPPNREYLVESVVAYFQTANAVARTYSATKTPRRLRRLLKRFRSFSFNTPATT